MKWENFENLCCPAQIELLQGNVKFSVHVLCDKTLHPEPVVDHYHYCPAIQRCQGVLSTPRTCPQVGFAPPHLPPRAALLSISDQGLRAVLEMHYTTGVHPAKANCQILITVMT